MAIEEQLELNISDVRSEGLKWIERIEEASAEEKTWREKAYQCNNVYLNKKVRGRGYSDTIMINSDENGQFGTLAGGFGRRPHSNIFYRNIKTAESVILPKLPDIVIRPKSAKQDSDSSDRRKEFSMVSDIVLRTVSSLLMDEKSEKEAKKFKHDVLVMGRGVLWLMYSPADENGEGETLEIKRIGINDFRMSPARCWEEVSWVARRILMSKKDFKERYGNNSFGVVSDDDLEEVPLSYPNADDKKLGVLKTAKSDSVIKMAELWEVWDKDTKTVKLVCKGIDEVLEEYDDPYNLKGFFPTPEPLYAVDNVDSMVPVPELDIYWNEAIALSEMTRRRLDIIKNMKVRALISASLFRDIKSLSQAGDNAFIPTDGQTSAGLTQGVKLEDMIVYEPLEPRATALKTLGEESDRVENNIDKITGLGDAVAASNAINTAGGDMETATRTVMKGKFGNLRLIEKQRLFNDYIRSVYAIAVEIICSVFSLDTLQAVSEVQLRPEGQMQQYDEQGQPVDDGLPSMTWTDMLTYMRSKWMSGYILDVETEMNVWEKDGEEYQRRASLVETTLEQLQKYQDLFTSVPSAVDFAIDGTVHTMNSQTMTSRMRNAMENALERMRAEALQGAQEQSEEGSDDPQMVLAQAEQQKAEAQTMEAQNKQQEVQMSSELKARDVQIKQAEAQSTVQKEQAGVQLKMAELQAKRDREMETAEIERQRMELERMKLQMEMQRLQADAQLKDKAGMLKAQSAQEQTETEYMVAREKNETDIALKQAELQTKFAEKEQSENIKAVAEQNRTEAISPQGLAQ